MKPLIDRESLIQGAGIPPSLAHCSRDTWRGKWPEIRAGWRTILLHGPAGTGKTHIATAVFLERCAAEALPIGCSEREIGYSPYSGTRYGMVYGALWRDIPEAVEAMKPSAVDPDEALRSCMKAALLVFDDLGAERLTDFTIDRVSLILRHRHAWELPTIVTTNLAPSRLTGMDPRLASRLCGDVVIKRDGEDYRIRGARNA